MSSIVKKAPINRIYIQQNSMLSEINNILSILMKLSMIFMAYLLYIRLSTVNMNQVLEVLHNNNVTIIEDAYPEITNCWYNYWYNDL